MYSKLFVGPMSKNIVDAIIEYSEKNNEVIGLIASRRQVDYIGGYVNDWKTSEFSNYVRSKTKNIILVRDHGGPLQGSMDDDGVDSLIDDCKYLDILHIDVWKKYSDLNEGIKETIRLIEMCYNINNNILFEVGTEESIRHFDTEEIKYFIDELRDKLSSNIYSNIKYVVIQSGTKLKNNENIGVFDNDRLIEMVTLVKNNNFLSKEHNGDYLPIDLVNKKFDCGLDAINIAPEFGQIETKVLLLEFKKNNLFEEFFEICYNSMRWVKWVDPNFNPFENKEELINITGHYVLSNKTFLDLKSKIRDDIDSVIKDKITDKLIYLNKK